MIVGPLRDRILISDDKLNSNNWPACDNPPKSNMHRLHKAAARSWPRAARSPVLELEMTSRPHKTICLSISPNNSDDSRTANNKPSENPPA